MRGGKARRLRGLVIALAVALSSARPASAHPHVFIDSRVTFVISHGKIVGFRESWQFDQVFSDQLLQQFDEDQDGKLSPAESEKVAASTLPNLAQFRYFTMCGSTARIWVASSPALRNPIVFQGLAGLACEPSVTKDIKNAYYGGYVYPQQIKLKRR